MKTQTTKYCLRRSDSSLPVRPISRPSSTPIAQALNANPFYFAGQYLNKASSLYYLRARWYDPATAQFISVDPLVNVTHQPYQYVGDNPGSNTDPTGECECSAAGILAQLWPGPPADAEALIAAGIESVDFAAVAFLLSWDVLPLGAIIITPTLLAAAVGGAYLIQTGIQELATCGT